MTEQTPVEQIPGPADAYVQHLGRLKGAVQAMREMREPDVDQLLPLVKAGTEAYEACVARIEQVTRALEGLGIEGADAAPSAGEEPGV
ncbi:hypothetical protein J2T57_001609 [Natronocella acetinitrilica]|uniref:Uncharacterized protein n=1 Tax=Natronocella acetinitrilica TaxID=414046 RepID=A0AAE3G315_9GAMM|nr:exodeoxyribonuclease VII small subunit [Natronocella acetinitrilica]MCP1674507.1 hypothetical protein [Natronocella acetinitrilica]